MQSAPRQEPLFHLARKTNIALYLMLAVLAAWTAVEFAVPGLLGRDPAFVDFHVFYLVGEFASQGDVARTYDFAFFQALQDRLNPGQDGFMPWTYPAQFNLLLAGIAQFDLWLGYLIFTGLTLAAFLVVLHRLSGVHFPVIFVCMLPTIFVVIRCGQNGFLTGALIGLFCLFFLNGSARAGIPLGLMAIKPHLVLGLAAVALVKRGIGTIAIAAAVTLASVGAATLAFGADIWTAVANSAAASSEYLRDAEYPLFRMTSVYAQVRSWGGSADIAFAAQILTAVMALGLVVWTHVRGWERRRVLGVAVLASFCVSPYNYDYDLCAMGVALALLMPDVARLSSRGEQTAIVVGSWLAGGSGLILYGLSGRFDEVLMKTGLDGTYPSFGAIGYLLVAGVLLQVTARGETSAPRATLAQRGAA